MIALWLPLALAAEPSLPEPEPAALRTLHLDDPLQERLLGDAPAAVLPSSHGGTGSPWLGALAIVAAGSGLAFWLKQRTALRASEEDPVLRIVSRSSLGLSQLVVVDVRDGLGRTRRLLIGTGGSSPALVADLGDDEQQFDSAESSSSAPASEPEPLPAVPPLLQAAPEPPAPPPARRAPAARALYANIPGLMPMTAETAERSQRKRAAIALIDEVSRERRTTSGPPSAP